MGWGGLRHLRRPISSQPDWKERTRAVAPWMKLSGNSARPDGYKGYTKLLIRLNLDGKKAVPGGCNLGNICGATFMMCGRRRNLNRRVD